jgi:hypothetical protein
MDRVFSVVTVISNGLRPIAIGLGGIMIIQVGVLNLFYIGVIAMFVTAFLALTNKQIAKL